MALHFTIIFQLKMIGSSHTCWKTSWGLDHSTVAVPSWTATLGATKNPGSNGMHPGYNNVDPSVLMEELHRLRGEYWKHQCKMSLLEAVKPINTAPAQKQMVLGKHRDRHGRSYAWVLGQKRCAAWGGCCERGCGCCAQALDQCSSPGRDMAQETKEVKVLGHCKVECRCCIEYRG